VMLRLFKVDLRSVLADCLISLTEDGVKWLLEHACVVVPVEGLDHNDLKALYWVVNRGCVVEVDWHRRVLERNRLQNCLRAHAFDWETNLRQVKFSADDHLAS